VVLLEGWRRAREEEADDGGGRRRRLWRALVERNRAARMDAAMAATCARQSRCCLCAVGMRVCEALRVIARCVVRQGRTP
jgi:hypothetical protein